MKFIRGQLLNAVIFGFGLLSVCALVEFAGPMLAFGGRHPLENDTMRTIVIAALAAAGVGFVGCLWWLRERNTNAIESGIAQVEAAPTSDEKILSAKLSDALATLKKVAGGKANYLYDLPWYVIIGPPGSGKTTALVNSGLKFPLSRGATPAAVAGSGGTRFCDWWFTEQAVLIDTAGRYTTQDSDAGADSRSWLAFLDLLKKNRPRQPINGVIVAISLEDLLTAKPEDIEAHANAIRDRLVELHERLKVDFPVYALFTKADLVAGFSEFFSSFNERQRQQVWGATFQTTDRAQNMVGEVPVEFDALLARLTEFVTDRLQEEPTPSNRVALFGFPAQMARLRRIVHDFLNRIFEPTRYHANAMLRGFYFTSGTQRGTPIDQLLGALSRNFGAQEVKAARFSRLGKSYFLSNLIGKTIIDEANWVSTDPAAVRQVRMRQIVAYGSLASLCVVIGLAWSFSFSRNQQLIADANAAAADFVAKAEPYTKETTIADWDVIKTLNLLQKLSNLPVGYNKIATRTPLAETYGLSQRDALALTAVNAYRNGLERYFRPRLMFRLQELLDQNRDKPSAIYDPLKAYLMLTDPRHRNREFLTNWMRQDWLTLYPGAAYQQAREALEQHLAAMFDLDAGHEILIPANADLIAEAQRSLAHLSVAERAYALLKSQATKVRDWNAGKDCEDIGQIFSAGDKSADQIHIVGFLTYAGFHHALLDQLDSVREGLEKDRWVLGESAKQDDVALQYNHLSQDLLDLFTKEFVATWTSMLNSLKLRSLVADKPAYKLLSIAAAHNSPIKCILEAVRRETAVTAARDDLKTSDDPKKSITIISDGGETPGAKIEKAFKPYYGLVDSAPRLIDTVVVRLADINQSLNPAADPSHDQNAAADLSARVRKLRDLAAQLPQPFAAMLQAAGASFEEDLTNGELAKLRREPERYA